MFLYGLPPLRRGELPACVSQNCVLSGGAQVFHDNYSLSIPKAGNELLKCCILRASRLHESFKTSAFKRKGKDATSRNALLHHSVRFGGPG